MQQYDIVEKSMQRARMRAHVQQHTVTLNNIANIFRFWNSRRVARARANPQRLATPYRYLKPYHMAMRRKSPAGLHAYYNNIVQ
jgi:hypothetical protein